MSSDLFFSSEGDFFVQTERGEVFEHLTCLRVGDLPLPQGDLTPVYCPNPAQKGKFKIEGFVRGEPATPTTTLTRPLTTVANWLLEQKCAFEGWITYGCGGSRALPENYQLGVLVYGMQISNSRILAEAVAMEPGENARVMTDAELSYLDRRIVYQIAFARQSLANTVAANAIAFLPERCEDRCGAARGLCEQGYMVMDGLMYNSEVKKTTDGGATWAECSSDPFTYGGGDASDIVVVEIANGHRAIVSRGSTTMGEPAEVSITEDWGTTWNNIDVGTVNDQYINALTYYGGRIWAAATGGYIYMSSTLGDTWTAQESGVETAQDLNDIAMYSLSVGYAVGDNNAFLYTTDGAEWNARTGPAALTNLLSVAVNDKGHVFVGAADGNLYVSEDEGETWATRYSFGVGSVDFIAFDESLRYFGLLTYNNAAGVGTAYRSKDGGASWQTPAGQTATWNSGLNAGFICDQNNMFVVGEVHNGTTFVAKASPS